MRRERDLLWPRARNAGVIVEALTAAVFASTSGWHVGAGQPQACPGSRAADCSSVASWAATVPWRDCGMCLPHKTVAHLPPNGIAIELQVGFERNPPKWMQPLRWPPKLQPVVAPFEGLPRRIGVYQKYGFVRGWSTGLFVFFGRPNPSKQQRARATKELATVSFPNH